MKNTTNHDGKRKNYKIDYNSMTKQNKIITLVQKR